MIEKHFQQEDVQFIANLKSKHTNIIFEAKIFSFLLYLLQITICDDRDLLGGLYWSPFSKVAHLLGGRSYDLSFLWLTLYQFCFLQNGDCATFKTATQVQLISEVFLQQWTAWPAGTIPRLPWSRTTGRETRSALNVDLLLETESLMWMNFFQDQGGDGARGGGRRLDFWFPSLICGSLTS